MLQSLTIASLEPATFYFHYLCILGYPKVGNPKLGNPNVGYALGKSEFSGYFCSIYRRMSIFWNLNEANEAINWSKFERIPMAF